MIHGEGIGMSVEFGDIAEGRIVNVLFIESVFTEFHLL